MTLPKSEDEDSVAVMVMADAHRKARESTSDKTRIRAVRHEPAAIIPAPQSIISIPTKLTSNITA